MAPSPTQSDIDEVLALFGRSADEDACSLLQEMRDIGHAAQCLMRTRLRRQGILEKSRHWRRQLRPRKPFWQNSHHRPITRPRVRGTTPLPLIQRPFTEQAQMIANNTAATSVNSMSRETSDA